MRNFGFRLTTANLQFLTLAALAATLGAMATGHGGPGAYAAIAVALLLTSGLTYRSRTALGWLWHRITYRKKPRNISLYRHTQAGVGWDGARASAYIEIIPAPYEVTTTAGNSFTPERTIPIDEIREELVQYDIHLHHATVFTIGHKYARKTPISAVYHSAMGPTDALLYGRTIVEISVELAAAIDSANARQGRGSPADGLNNTVLVAAERIRRRISAAGHPARLLTAADLADLDTALRDELVPALVDEHWSHAGPHTMRALSYTPEANAWNAESYRRWCGLGEHRQVHAVRLSPGDAIGDHAEMYVTVISADSSALSVADPSGLRKEYGQQADILTAYVPSVRTTEPTAVPGKTLPPGSAFPIPLIPGGIGTFLGHTKNRERVFVNFTTGSAPFYLIAPARLCQQLLMRLSTSGRSIDIDSDDERWIRFAKRIGATSGTNPDADIIFSENRASAPTHEAQVRLVWTTNPASLSRRPEFALVARRDGTDLYTPDGVTRYNPWGTTKAEEAYFTFPDGAASPTAQPAPRPVTDPPAPPPPPPGQGERRPTQRAAHRAKAVATHTADLPELGRIPTQAPVPAPPRPASAPPAPPSPLHAPAD